MQVLPVEYGGQAKPLYVDEAVRAFKLPPYPHIPEMLVSPMSSGIDGMAEIALDGDEGCSQRL